jgi:hypothetical protein
VTTFQHFTNVPVSAGNAILKPDNGGRPQPWLPPVLLILLLHQYRTYSKNEKLQNAAHPPARKKFQQKI